MSRYRVWLPESEEGAERQIGSLLFADPCKADFTRQIHLFNEPYSRLAGPESTLGIRSVTARETTWHDPKRRREEEE